MPIRQKTVGKWEKQTSQMSNTHVSLLISILPQAKLNRAKVFLFHGLLGWEGGREGGLQERATNFDLLTKAAWQPTFLVSIYHCWIYFQFQLWNKSNKDNASWQPAHPCNRIPCLHQEHQFNKSFLLRPSPRCPTQRLHDTSSELLCWHNSSQLLLIFERNCVLNKISKK